MPRKACVIQITPVRLTSTSANDASVVRKIYLSIDPIVPARSPSTETEPATASIPDRDSPRLRRCPRIGTLSHYHPFDRSTKWLRHGTFETRLIFGEMWPPRHVGAWQHGVVQAIVAASLKTGSLALRARGKPL